MYEIYNIIYHIWRGEEFKKGVVQNGDLRGYVRNYLCEQMKVIVVKMKI